MPFQDNLLVPSPIGQRIKKAREALGISQLELAMRLGRDQSAISSYEAGRRRLSADDIPLFAKELDVPIIYFYEDYDSPRDLEHQMLVAFESLSTAEAKRSAIQIVQILSETIQQS